MKNYLLAATAALAVTGVATPAAARDGSGYVGLEAGVLFPRDQNINGSIDFATPADGISDLPLGNVADVEFKTGYDIDLIGGYDFGMFRLEGELGYKHTKAKQIDFDNDFIDALNAGAGTTFTDDDFDINGKASVLSAMVNGLVDFGGNGGVGGYVGAGFGRARVKEFGDRDSAWAWQLLAGVYAPVSDNIDVGLKYRYFRTGKLDFNNDFVFAGTEGGSAGTAVFGIDDRFSSHSLLASLVYNFGGAGVAAAPPPPPPPPPQPAPEAPATQTCPDGSVILATSACPAPPPPPPPPAPLERGERGQ
jgi:opacity protein-like surface antigen